MLKGSPFQPAQETSTIEPTFPVNLVLYTKEEKQQRNATFD